MKQNLIIETLKYFSSNVENFTELKICNIFEMYLFLHTQKYMKKKL